MKLSIISDGTKAGTFVVDAETGKRVENVSEVRWSIKAREGISVATITIEDYQVSADLIAPRFEIEQVVHCSNCGLSHPYSEFGLNYYCPWCKHGLERAEAESKEAHEKALAFQALAEHPRLAPDI